VGDPLTMTTVRHARVQEDSDALADITEFRVLELIEAERQERVMNGESGSGSR
jgi:hypothetical protein